MTFRNTLLIFCTVSVALTGCHRTLDIARPIPGTLAPPPIEDSTLSTVANTSMGSVCSQLNGLIPHPIAENPGHPCFQYGVYQHTNLACSGNANTLDASFQVAYKAGQRCGVDGVGQASCGYDHEMYATVGAGVTLSWDPSWHADVTIAPRISLDTACRVTVLDVNINGFVHDKIQPTLDNITRQAPGKIAAATDMRGRAAAMWTEVNQPISLGNNVWLMLHPKAVMAANPNLASDVVTLSAGITARPEVIISPNAPEVSSSPLPPLQPGPISNAFHVALVGSVSWNDATTLLSKPYLGKQYKAGPFKKINIDSINVLGNGNTMVVEVKVSGSITGSLFLQGTPTYVRSRAGNVVEDVEVPDLDFTPDTRNVLAKSADWVLHSTLRNELRAKAVFPLGTRLADLQAKLQNGINRQLGPNAKLSGKIDNLTLRGVYLSNDALTVQAVANGTTQISIQ
jgi:hypothetical protein